MIEELDRVVILRAVPENGIVAGDIGTVVAVHQDGRGYTLEFTSLRGETIAIVTLEAKDVRPAEDREIAHVRSVA